ncbi:hypothetical protein AB835_05620 [Candidatus Endobugula sertula]|uniref:Uncharacterized protein n=1 Tax=Candidatus Endobugula sertula TaxID=62101 RepID=A0A1D2QR35_9GAMM|nr:hypothetical protein AB835_05620 [Candidatus Endobugula sertula]
MQLILKKKYGESFHLHVVIMIHPGVPQGVFENIENVFESLSVRESSDISVRTAVRGGHYVELKKALFQVI